MLIPYNTLKQELKRVLIKHGMNDDKADLCADIFAGNSRDGVYSHGLNRFPQFISSIGEGLIMVNAEPVLISGKGCIETGMDNLLLAYTRQQKPYPGQWILLRKMGLE